MTRRSARRAAVLCFSRHMGISERAQVKMSTQSVLVRPLEICAHIARSHARRLGTRDEIEMRRYFSFRFVLFRRKNPPRIWTMFCFRRTTRGIGEVSLKENLPVAFGLLTTDDLQQSIERSGNNAENKGEEAALTVLEMITLFNQMDGA